MTAPLSAPATAGPLWAVCWRHGVRWRLPYALLASGVIFVLSSLPVAFPRGLPGIDKAAHGLAYFLLTLAYLNVATRGWGQPGALRVLAALAAAGLYGLSDEWHQSFVPGRTFDWADLVADGVGALAAAGLTGLLARLARAAGTRPPRPAVPGRARTRRRGA